MTRRSLMKTRYLTALATGMVLVVGAARAQGPAEQARAEMKQALGTVPAMLRAYPDAGQAGAWAMTRDVQLSGTTALAPRYKELIGLAVAAQIPCEYCVYFHTQAAKANGASDAEIREAVAMAAITRHWSTVLNGTQPDMGAFRKEVDGILRHAAAPKDK